MGNHVPKDQREDDFMHKPSFVHVIYLLAILALVLAQTPLSRAAPTLFDSPIPGPTPTTIPTQPAPSLTGGVTLTAAMEPEAVGPGRLATLTWSVANDGVSALTDLVLTAAMPSGLQVGPASVRPSLNYSAQTRQLQWRIARLEASATSVAQVKVRVAGLQPGEVGVVTTDVQSAAGDVLAHAEATIMITPRPPLAGTMSPAGGEITFHDGRVRLTFAPGAVSERVHILARVLPRPTDAPGHIQRAFEIVAVGQGGAEHHTFDAPVTLTVHDPDHLTGSERFVLQNNETGEWEPLTTTWDAAAGALSANLPHLSLVGQDGSHMPLTLPTIRGIQTDLFTGAATVSYPIPTPPGAGGLATQLALTFNSASRADDSGYTSVVGAGWKLSVDSYGAQTAWVAGSPPPVWRVDGTTYDEAPDSLRQAPDWRRVKQGEYVYLYRPDGTTYQFAEALHDFWCEGTTLKWRAETWALQKVTDALGNTIEYQYDNELPVRHSGDGSPNVNENSDRVRSIALYDECLQGTNRYLSQLNLQRIVYNGGRSVIEFGYYANGSSLNYRKDGPFAKTDDEDSDNFKYWAFFTTRLLKTIKIKQDGRYIAGYLFGYDERVSYDGDGRIYPNKSRYYLKGAQQVRIDPLTGALSGWEDGLPETHYRNYRCTNTNDPCQVTDGCSRTWDHLYEVDNMYGGKVCLAYVTGQSDGTIVKRSVTDQVTGRVETWNYTFSGPIQHEDSRAGYQFATVMLPASLTNPGTTSTVYHEFLDDDAISAQRLGKERLRRYTVNGILQTEIERSWEDELLWPGGPGITLLTREEERTFDAGGANAQLRVTGYEYQRDHQGGEQYGLATRVSEYLGADNVNVNPLRVTERWYYPTPTDANNHHSGSPYIVNRLAQEKLLDDAGTCLRQTRYNYDAATGVSGYTSVPTAGLLAETWQAGNQGAACDDGWLRAAAYTYDNWGNQRTTTAPDGRVTTIGYDTGYAVALYPVSETVTPAGNPAGALTTGYSYYNLTGAEAGGSGRAGQLQAVTDPNGAVTRYSYDDFGRLKEVRRPGVEFTESASETYTYSDVPWPDFGAKNPAQYPLRVHHALRTDASPDGSGSTTYLDDWTYYDGLGQAIQTQTPGTTAGQAVITDMVYDADGHVITQTVPYFREFQNNPDLTPGHKWVANLGQPKTTLRYDALGRPVQQTAPDGATTRTFYNGRQTATLDALNHQMVREVDALGRLVVTRQYLGSFSNGPNWNAAPYAEATYGYAPTDELAWAEQMVDATTRLRTTLSYDRLGHKVAITDPDLGSWSYGYDSSGRLTRQTDARGQTICFYYDGHGRLVGKHYRTNQACPTPAPATLDVTYAYDVGPNALGRRTAATVYAGATADNTHTWSYDARGRVSAETRTITGAPQPYYTTGYSYDQADRVRQTTYPDGEVVTTAYDGRGRPLTLTGSSSGALAANAAYDAAGRLTTLQLPAGGNLWRTQQYHPWTQQGGGLRYLTVGSAPDLGERLSLTNYTYDAVGNLTGLTDGSTAYTFAYDDLHRLMAAYGQGYSYDAVGRLTQMGGRSLGYDPAHPHAVARINGVQAFVYDANGNQIVRSIWNDPLPLTWDAENRLQRIGWANPPGPSQSPPPPAGPHRAFLPMIAGQSLYEVYTYDADGARVTRATRQTITYTVGPHYAVTVPVGGGPAQATRHYFLGGLRLASAGPGGLTYLHSDHLGSPLAATNSAGVTTGSVRYDAYGNARVGAPAALPTDRGYTGQLSDATGLLNYGARYYDPAVGSFISPDSSVPGPGNPQALNRYSYTNNNPLRYTDPSGRFSEEELLDTYDAFIGPKQLHSMRDRPETAYWYYLLRAAELGDTVKFWGYEQGNVTGQIIAQDGKLWIAGSDGGKYSIGWEGIGGAGSGIIPQTSQLTKANGVAFHTQTQLRRYVNGPRSALDVDYGELAVGGYWGVGFHVSVKRDRYQDWHLGINGGLGVGKFGLSLEAGYLMQDSPPDPGQLSQALDGWGVGAQAGAWLGGAVSTVNSGPLPVQVGFSTPGAALTVSYTWLLGGGN